jgi:hypothetical protein
MQFLMNTVLAPMNLKIVNALVIMDRAVFRRFHRQGSGTLTPGGAAGIGRI